MTEAIPIAEARRRRAKDRRAKRAAPRDDPADATPATKANGAEFAAEIERLAKLNALSFERERRDAARKLGVTIGFLDRQVAAARQPPKTNGLPEIEPWHEPVDGAALLDELAAAIKRHVSVPTRAEDAAALWILHSHCINAAEWSPRLAITSPSPECGKSTLLRIVGDLVPRKLAASNITAAATFRAIEMWRPTLLIDEADTFLRDNDELRGVLNSGHSRAEAFVVRTVGDDHEPQCFSTWGALVIAQIGKLPATLESRAIHIELQRLARGEKVEPIVARRDLMQTLRAGARAGPRTTSRPCAMPSLIWRALPIVAPTIGARCSSSPTRPAATGPAGRAAPVKRRSRSTMSTPDRRPPSCCSRTCAH